MNRTLKIATWIASIILIGGLGAAIIVGTNAMIANLTEPARD